MFINFIKKYKDIFFWVFVLITIFLSFFPRSIEVLNENPVFGFDQGREMLAAKNIVVNHKLILIGTEIGAGSAGISGVFQGPIYYYILSIPFILFDGDPMGGIYLMWLFSLGSILFGFYFGYKIFNKWVGLLVSLLIAVSPTFISQARFIWSPYPPTLFILLSLYFTYYIKKRDINIFFASFFAGFIYNFEIAIAIPMSLALFLYSIVIFKNNLRKYLFVLSGFLIAYIPMIFFEIRHNFLGVSGVISYVTHRNPHLKSLTTYIPDHLSSFIYNFKITFPNIDSNLSLIFFIVLISISLFFLIKEKNKDRKYFFSFLILLIPINFFIFIFLRNTVWTYYLSDLNLVYIFIFSYSTYSSFSSHFKMLSLSLILLLLFLTLLGIINSIQTYNHDINDYGGTAKLKGKIDAIDYIYKDAKGNNFGLLVFSPPVYTYPYDYLLWWYGERKYHYIPYSKKKGTFYLLIEVDSSKPWSYKGWLQTVIKSGKIDWTKTLPSGFIVQKRYVN